MRPPWRFRAAVGTIGRTRSADLVANRTKLSVEKIRN